MGQASSNTSPQNLQRPNREAHEHQNHASSSSEQGKLENNLEVVVEQNYKPPPAADQINDTCTTAESQTRDTVVPLDEGMAVNAEQLRAGDQEYDKTRVRLQLQQAAMNGEWGEMGEIIKKHPDLVSEPITEDDETALHIAVGAKNTPAVENLINTTPPDDIARRNKYGNTALFFAAASGVVKIAKKMVEKNKELPYIRDLRQVTPLLIAVLYRNTEMASYLFSVTELHKLKHHEQLQLLIATINNDFYDISWEILKENPELATMRDAKNNHETALHVLARKSSAFTSTNQLNIWKKCINFCTKCCNCNKDVMKPSANKLLELLWKPVIKFTKGERLKFISHPSNLLRDAASAGNVKFLTLLIRIYPNMILEEDKHGQSIFHIAIENRLEDVFNLIMHEIRGLKEFSLRYILNASGKYNMLHLAAKLATPNHLNRVSGAVLQMQRELLWFKEVEKITLPYQLEAKGKNRLTAREFFTNEHKNLRKDGEEWMKNTANSCMLVATLIATIVFAAAFTVPGGSDDNLGTPIFQQNIFFSIFVISDAIALISSSTSILIFLSILTSRFAEEDFLHSLPNRLLFGFMWLFISIVCMVVAFSATFFMLYHKANVVVPVTIATLAIVPISYFFVLQFKLWVDILYNTCYSRFLFKDSSSHRFFSTFRFHFPAVLNDHLKKINFRDHKREQENE